MHAISLISLALMLSRFVLCVHIALRDAFNLTLAGLIVAVSSFKSRLPLPFVRPLCTARNFWAFPSPRGHRISSEATTAPQTTYT